MKENHIRLLLYFSYDFRVAANVRKLRVRFFIIGKKAQKNLLFSTARGPL